MEHSEWNKTLKLQENERMSFLFNINLACSVQILKLCLNDLTVFFSQDFFHPNCRVPFLFTANVNTCIVNRIRSSRKREDVLEE